MQRRLRRNVIRLLATGLISTLLLLGSVATALAGNEPGPWP